MKHPVDEQNTIETPREKASREFRARRDQILAIKNTT